MYTFTSQEADTLRERRHAWPSAARVQTYGAAVSGPSHWHVHASRSRGPFSEATIYFIYCKGSCEPTLHATQQKGEYSKSTNLYSRLSGDFLTGPDRRRDLVNLFNNGERLRCYSPFPSQKVRILLFVSAFADLPNSSFY